MIKAALQWISPATVLGTMERSRVAISSGRLIALALAAAAAESVVSSSVLAQAPICRATPWSNAGSAARDAEVLNLAAPKQCRVFTVLSDGAPNRATLALRTSAAWLEVHVNAIPSGHLQIRSAGITRVDRLTIVVRSSSGNEDSPPHQIHLSGLSVGSLAFENRVGTNSSPLSLLLDGRSSVESFESASVALGDVQLTFPAGCRSSVSIGSFGAPVVLKSVTIGALKESRDCSNDGTFRIVATSASSAAQSASVSIRDVSVPSGAAIELRAARAGSRHTTVTLERITLAGGLAIGADANFTVSLLVRDVALDSAATGGISLRAPAVGDILLSSLDAGAEIDASSIETLRLEALGRPSFLRVCINRADADSYSGVDSITLSQPFTPGQVALSPEVLETLAAKLTNAADRRVVFALLAEVGVTCAASNVAIGSDALYWRRRAELESAGMASFLLARLVDLMSGFGVRLRNPLILFGLLFLAKACAMRFDGRQSPPRLDLLLIRSLPGLPDSPAVAATRSSTSKLVMDFVDLIAAAQAMLLSVFLGTTALF